MKFQTLRWDVDTPPDNVVPFPGAHRDRDAIGASIAAPSRKKRPVAVTGAELNARLLILLGICTTSAAIVLSAVHILHGP